MKQNASSDMLFVYLHGYKGSPISEKGKKLKKFLLNNYTDSKIYFPLMRENGMSSFKKLNDFFNNENRNKIIIGSSFGGFLAHLLKQTREDVKSVILINPVSRLDLLVQEERFYDVRESALKLYNLLPQQNTILDYYLLLLQDDDKITPFEDAISFYRGAKCNIQSGQGHNYHQIEVVFKEISSFINQYL